MEMEKKVALITGSSSGLGAVTAVEFAKKGIRVTITGRRTDRLKEVFQKCLVEGLDGNEVLVMAGDVTDDGFIQSVVKATVDKFGRLDILVNNAAFVGDNHGVMGGTMNVYDKVMRTNLRAPIMFTKEAVPLLEKTKGCIVNVSSIFSMLANKRGLLYAISKAALDQLTKCSSTELAAKDIRVNSVNPGYFESTINEQVGLDRPTFMKFLERAANIQPLHHIVKSEDVAKAILFLTSEDARFITGTTLFVDGGYSNVVPIPNIAGNEF